MGAAAPMHFPGAGKNVYACMSHMRLCLMLYAPHTKKAAGRSSGGGLEGNKKVFGAVRLGGAAQPQPARFTLGLSSVGNCC
jgi:hypothetical protein